MIGIVVSVFNKPITDGLLEGCIKSLNENGLKEENINVVYVPGAFELPAKVKKLTENNSYDCIIALGCIIKGETDHYHYISQAVTNGIMSLTLEKNSPHIIFGVLTCQNKELAYARSGDNEKNKGYEAGTAAFHQIKKRNILN